jgi:class 3 adenylate cyclase
MVRGSTHEASGPTAEDLPRRAGVRPELVDALIERGVIAAGPDGRFSTGDIRRARIVQQLIESGLPFDALAEAITRRIFPLDFVDSPAYGRIAAHADVTFRALAARTEVPIELLLALREASGSTPPAPDDLVRENELEMVPALACMVEYGVREASIERTLRAYGESFRRIAEVEADWWSSDVIGPIFAAGGSASEVAIQTGPFADRLAPLTDRLALALFHAHQANAWMKNIFEGAEGVLASSGLHQAIDRPPAISFLDLTGYTRLTEEHGDAAAAETAGRLGRLVQRISREHGGRPIKWLGDGVMFHFREPGGAVLSALAMVEAAAAAELPRAHVGIHAGPILFQEADYFGRTVNLAARIADYARQGEVLVSDVVVDAAVDTPGLRFDEIGPVELKGMSEPVRLHVAHRNQA